MKSSGSEVVYFIMLIHDNINAELFVSGLVFSLLNVKADL